jgi:hypothetical protein
MPWGVSDENLGNLGLKGNNFERIAKNVCGCWLSFCVTNRNHTKFFHHNSNIYNLLSTSKDGAEQHLNISSFPMKERWAFFLSQDSYLNRDEIMPLVKQSLQQNANCLRENQ